MKRLLRLTQFDLDFRPVPSADIVIIYSQDAEDFSQYFPGKRVLTIDIDSNRRNIRPLCRSLLSFNYRLSSYLAAAINESGARLAISNQDNLLELFRVQGLLRDTRLVLIQNGIRSMRDDLADVTKHPKDSLSVDTYLGFNAAQETWMRQMFRGEYRVIGSFRSNHTARAVSSEPVVSYISTLNPNASVHRKFTSPNGSVITYGEMLEYRLGAIRTIQQLSADVGCTLRILGKRIAREANAEYAFYREKLGENSFEFVEKRDRYSNYPRCDESRLVVSTSSSLGLESLGRGNRTLLIHGGARRLGDVSLQFGWPESLPESGPFWLPGGTTYEISRCFEDLWSRKTQAWEQDLARYRRFIPVHDPGNTLFCETLREFGAQSPLLPPSVA